MKTEQYTIDYFIKKFEAIPEELWCTGNYVNGNACCALGYCGKRNYIGTKQSVILEELFNISNLSIPLVNDGEHLKYQQPTPKQRILAALNDFKLNEK